MGLVLPYYEDVVNWDANSNERDSYADFHGVGEAGENDDKRADDEERDGEDDTDSDGSLEVRAGDPHPQEACDRC